MRLLSAAAFCICLPILVTSFSAFAGSKNVHAANLFCKMLGLGEAMRIEGNLTPYMEWQFGHGGKSLSDATSGWVNIKDAPGRFRFDKIQCQEKLGSTMSAWLEDYVTGRVNNTFCR